MFCSPNIYVPYCMDLKRMEYDLKGYAYHYTGNRGKELDHTLVSSN